MKDKYTGNFHSFCNAIGISAIAFFLFTCIYLSLINGSLWFDEAYSLAMIDHSWNEILEITGRDFHPPLYYFILKAGNNLFGNSIFTMRMISVFPIILLLLFVRKFLLKYFGTYTFLLFVLAFLASSTVMLYSLEIRMYSYSLFFVTLTFISAYNAIKTNSNEWYFSLFIFFLATFYTQYYSGILVGIAFIFLIGYTIRFNKKRKVTVLSIGFISFLLYLPWLSVLLSQIASASDDFVLLKFQYSEILTYIISFFKSGTLLTTIALFTIFSVILWSFLIKPNKSFDDYFFFCGLLSIAILVAFGVLLSVIIRPLFMPRYLVPACGLVWLFFATQTSLNFKNTTFKIALLSVMFVIAVHHIIVLSGKPQMQGFVDFKHVLSKSIKQEDIIVIPEPENSGLLIGVIAYLFPNHTMAITHKKAILKENHILNYHNGPFRMDIIRYSDISKYPKVKKWLIIPYNAENKKPDSYALEHTVNYRGNFGWIGYISGNQFDLYEISPRN